MNIPPLGGTVRRFTYGEQIDPARDWLVLLVAGGIVLTGIVVWNVWAFDTVAQGGAIGASTSGAFTEFTPTTLEMIHAVFEKRATEAAKYETGVYDFADPSQ